MLSPRPLAEYMGFTEQQSQDLFDAALNMDEEKVAADKD